MWDRVTPADIAEAKEEIAARRAEILARHAAEIHGLDADEAQLDALAGLVATFITKFKTPASEAPAAAAAVLAAKKAEPEGDRGSTLEVAGFDRPVLPDQTRLTPGETAVSIDFNGSRGKSDPR